MTSEKYHIRDSGGGLTSIGQNLTPGEAKVIRSHELESENIDLKKRIKYLELMVETYESAYENGGSEEGITEYMGDAMQIFHPEKRVHGLICISESDMDWLDKELQELVIENHKKYGGN